MIKNILYLNSLRVKKKERRDMHKYSYRTIDFVECSSLIDWKNQFIEKNNIILKEKEKKSSYCK